MIIGLLTRHYKIYKALNYIPIGDQLDNNLSIYVGNNGVGKSSILEALNTLFNNGYWNKHKDGKQDEAFICPVFFIQKDKFNSQEGVTKDDICVFEELSKYFWNFPKPTSTEISAFFKTREYLANLYSPETYYLFIAGNTYKNLNKTYYGSPFHRQAIEVIKKVNLEYKEERVLNFLRKYYSFVYIPVESKVSDTLKLETFEMQQLMNKDILETIDKVLKTKEFMFNSSSKINVVTYLNKALNDFMDSINKQVKNIDAKYSFKVDSGYKKNLTAFDLREKILEAYFSIRTLKKETKEISELSSGEQRIALIDIASAFLSSSGEKEGYLVLAIDEPEASMHISKCFDQFKRLEKVADQDDLQVLLTTHWYGSLPTIQKGNLHHIDIGDKPIITTFDFHNYLEERRIFPDDIEMKSFFELVSTIISSIKNEKVNWLICEGSDDKKYLTHYLRDKVDNLFIIPVGGCGNVIKLYEYLFVPFTEKKEKNLLGNSKVLCLIDSDINQNTTRFSQNSNNSQLKIQRLQLNKDSSFELKNLSNAGTYIPTTIEDCLAKEVFYEALKQTVEENSSEEVKELFGKFSMNTNYSGSRVEGEDTLLVPQEITALEEKQKLYEEFKTNKFKYVLADNYIKIASTIEHNTPKMIEKILDFYNLNP